MGSRDRLRSLRWAGYFGAAALFMLLAAAGTAQARTVTVGSPLTATANGTSVCLPSCIWANAMLGEPGANATSPISGVIVRWRTAGPYTGGPFELRVLSPAPGGGPPYTANGTSSPETPSGSAAQAFPTNLPIKAGDLIGLEETSASGIARTSSAPGSATLAWNPALTDGEIGPPSDGPFANFELLFNADVATPPDNSFSFGGLTHNPRKGTATLTVTVPGAGRLELTGNGVKAMSSAGSTVAGAGPVPLRVAARGSKRKKLNANGKVRLNVGVTYTPSGDLASPSTQNRSVKLIKRP